MLSIAFDRSWDTSMPVLLVDGQAAAFIAEMELAESCSLSDNAGLIVTKLRVYLGQYMGRPMVELPKDALIEVIPREGAPLPL
jgi:hypothetical protein